MASPVLYETHMHTPLCGHAIGEPEEYAAVAKARGLKGIIITCHNPIPGWGKETRMRLDQFPVYQAMTERARRAWEGQVDVRLGLECDYAPELERWLKEQLQKTKFHHVLGSIHAQVPEYMRAYFRNDWFEYQKVYFDHLARSAESGFFDTLAHPDLIKNFAPEEWQLERIERFILNALDRIAATKVSMELNTSGLNKAVAEMNPGPWMLKEMRRRDISVVVGADAHQPSRVAAEYEEAFLLLEEAGYDTICFYLDRQRQEVTIAQARETLQPVSA